MTTHTTSPRSTCCGALMITYYGCDIAKSTWYVCHSCNMPCDIAVDKRLDNFKASGTGGGTIGGDGKICDIAVEKEMKDMEQAMKEGFEAAEKVIHSKASFKPVAPPQEKEEEWETDYNDLCPDYHKDSDGNPFPAKGSPSYLAHMALIKAFIARHDKALDETIERMKVYVRPEITTWFTHETKGEAKAHNAALSAAQAVVRKGGK